MTLFSGWSKASSTKQFFYVSLPILLKISQEFFNSETYETQLIPSVPHQVPLAVKSPGLTSVIFVALAPQNVASTGVHIGKNNPTGPPSWTRPHNHPCSRTSHSPPHLHDLPNLGRSSCWTMGRWKWWKRECLCMYTCMYIYIYIYIQYH